MRITCLVRHAAGHTHATHATSAHRRLIHLCSASACADQNSYLPDPAGPWGGVKSSGIGRELGPGAVAAHQQLKTIYL